MNQRVRSALVATYLLSCILFGGSGQGVWTNLGLQLLGLALIAVAALAAEPAEERGRPAFVYLLLAAGGLLVLFQLIPLPAAIWTGLTGRAQLAESFTLLGQANRALPISLTPYESVAALFAAIPGLAMFIAVKLLRPSPRWLALAIGAAMTIAIGLGALQVAAGGDEWRFYPISSPGAVGVFANVNHMATLLLVSIPFGAALVVSWKGEGTGTRQARWIVAVAGLLLVVIGIALNGSRAALALSLPVLLASAALTPAALRWRPIALPAAAIVLIGGLMLLATGPLSAGAAAADERVASRQEIWATTLRAIGDTFPMGTGLGSFQDIYSQYEDQAQVATSYVNHAHNDYLELVLELGAPGLVLILLFLLWWGLATIRIWTSQLSTPFERAATIASAAILAHSVVDFPLRTAAIAAVFGVAIALMAQPLRSRERSSASERRPTRHVKLG